MDSWKKITITYLWSSLSDYL